MFAADTWGGVSKILITRIQILQDRAAKVALGHLYEKKSKSQRLKLLGWPCITDEVKIATLRLTHKVLHQGSPDELALKMPKNKRNWIIKKTFKLDTKPKFLT